MLDDGSISQDDYDETLYKKIGKKQMDSLSKKDLQVLAIYRQMMSGSALDPQTIKNDDVSNKEYAAVSQNYLIYLV
ncbi:penicillin-binding protein 3 [Staphylococcus gallinarum]|uniref:Penicillin-binding protein 3 n=1 Tax=Staphylococcus gallinarum TaxID=1293 RepID=A0A380FGA3_STAGA|nr:penicillin-binding protein 3 [Staphylococcus gallinarum]